MNQNIDFIPFARPSFGKEEEEAVLSVLRSGWITTGNEALNFEKEFAQFVGVPKAFAVNSATSGLLLSMEAFGVGKNDIIITSPYTFTSTAAVAIQLGAEVKFCDTEKDSYLIDPKELEKILSKTDNCKLVAVVHVGGNICDMSSIIEIVKNYEKRVNHRCYILEDSAHSFPSRTKMGMAGTIGDAGVYSFYATKTITTGEGGMIVAKDEKIQKRIALMRLHGFDREAWNRYTSKKPAWEYSIAEAGYKCNLPDILATIGRQQLKKADKFLNERKEIAEIYDSYFSKTDKLIIPPRSEASSWHLYSLRTSKNNCPSRDTIIEKLAEQGIGTSVHFIPLHTMPFYANRYNLKPESYKNAYEIFLQTLSLPIWQGMGKENAIRVAQKVMEIVGEYIG